MQTKTKNRSFTFTLFLALFIAFLTCSLNAMEADTPEIVHPMMQPKMYTTNMLCPNCGMMINMWARTRHTFTNSDGAHETCSIRCLADMSQKIGEDAQNVQVALYVDPDTMIDADKAFYVVGSKAKGTMTMISKIAFSSENEAQAFAQKNGGKIHSFAEANEMATTEVNKTRDTIQSNRINKGKIVLPTSNDSCSVCGMAPANYPNNHAQLVTTTGDHFHFCSTKCLINYLEDPENHAKRAAETKEIYTTVYPDGDYEYAKGLYYVVGSKEMGPMGTEAFAFRKKSDALSLVEKKGGKVVQWQDLKPSLIMGNSGGMMKMSE